MSNLRLCLDNNDAQLEVGENNYESVSLRENSWKFRCLETYFFPSTVIWSITKTDLGHTNLFNCFTDFFQQWGCRVAAKKK